MHRPARLFREESGSTMVEFAIIAPIFILLIFGIIEFSLIMFVKSTMEGATSVTSRLGKTGYVAEGQTREDMLIALLSERTFGVLDPEEIEISTLVYESFADIGEAEPLPVDTNHNGQYDPADGDTYQDINGNGQWDADLGTAGLGGAGDIVVYNVRYPWQVKTPVISRLLSNEEGYYPLDVSVVVRNEPYNRGS